MTDKSNGKPRSVSLSSQSFVEEPLCELCFEDALKVGATKSSRLKPEEFDATSIRPCVDGLIKRYKSFAQRYRSSVFALIRDVSWYWASFCETDEVLKRVTREYFSLLHDITENYCYLDLEDRMDIGGKVKEIGYRKRPLNIIIPREAHGVITDCATAVGTNFTILFQVGLCWALTRSSQMLYNSWREDVFSPLFNEMMGKAEKRLIDFVDIRDSIRSRELRKGGVDPWSQ